MAVYPYSSGIRVIMPKQKTPLQELYERTAEKRDNPDKRDAAEKVPTGEVNKNPENLSEYEENPGDVGPNTRVPTGSDPDKPAAR